MTNYSQKDSRWENVKLGTSKATIGSVGCYLVSFSILTDIDPITLNKLFIEKKVYQDGNMMVSKKAAQVLGLEHKGTTTTRPSRICIAETDHYKSKGVPQHFFVWLGDGRIIDPLGGKTKNNPYHIVKWILVYPKGDDMLKQGEYRKYNGVGGELLVHILAPPVAQRVLGNGWGSNLLPIRNIVPNDCSGIQRAFDDYAEAERKKEATYVNKIETLGANIKNLESEIASLKEQNEALKANPQVVEKEVEKIIEVDSTKNVLQKFVDLIKSLIGKE